MSNVFVVKKSLKKTNMINFLYEHLNCNNLFCFHNFLENLSNPSKLVWRCFIISNGRYTSKGVKCNPSQNPKWPPKYSSKKVEKWGRKVPLGNGLLGETGSSCYNVHVLKHILQTKRATLIIPYMGQDDYLFLWKSLRVLTFELTV